MSVDSLTGSSVAEEISPIGTNGHIPFSKALDDTEQSTYVALKDEVPEKTVFLTVTLSRLGVRRKVSSSLVDTDADKSLLHVAKEILDSKELKEVQSVDTEIRTYLRTRCLPATFRRGFYILPLALLKEVDGKLYELKSNREKLVDEFLEVYPTRVAEARVRLGGLFSNEDYPDLDTVQKAFGMQVRYINFGVPGTLLEVSKEIYEREKAEIAGELRETMEEVRMGLRAGFMEMVKCLTERLGSKDDGKPKTFKSPTIAKFKDFLEVFDARNVTDDEDLSNLVGKARGLITGIDAQTLRTDLTIRDMVKDGMGEVLSELETITVVDAPTRKYKFHLEDEENG